MKRMNVWFLVLSIAVPALLAFSANGDKRERADKEIATGQIMGYVEWTADQKTQVAALKTARDAQIKPLQEQIKQLQLQIKAINQQFEKSLAALLTPDQIAAAQDAFRKAEHRRMEERKLAEERRAEDGDRHGRPTSRPAETTEDRRHTDADKRLLEERRVREAERRDGETRHDTGTSTSRPADDRRGDRSSESKNIQEEIDRLNHRLNELRHEEKELKDEGK